LYLLSPTLLYFQKLETIIAHVQLDKSLCNKILIYRRR